MIKFSEEHSFNKGKKILKEKGFSQLIRSGIFKFLANRYDIPSRKIGVFNGVAVRGVSLQSNNDIFPEHEAELIAAIRSFVKNKDVAVVVGGGSGASTVAVAHMVGNHGKVTTFEGEKYSVEKVKETLKLNKVDDWVSVKHAIIEKPIHLEGDTGDAKIVYSKDLPDCDSLIMDCEGAELPILKNLKIRPKLIIVETHTAFDSPKEKVAEELEQLGYKIISSEVRQESLDVLSAILETSNAKT